MIDTILFDFVGVLLFPKESQESNPLVDEIDRLIGTVTNDSTFKEKVTHEHNLSESEFKTILQAIVNKYEPFVPLWKLLPRLRKRYKLGIVNNGTYLTYPLFEARYHLSQVFDDFLSSAVVGVCKPDHDIYLQACERIDSQPRNCLFMDDSEGNIIGAKSVGMQTIHWPTMASGFQAFETYLRTHERIKTA